MILQHQLIFAMSQGLDYLPAQLNLFEGHTKNFSISADATFHPFPYFAA